MVEWGGKGERGGDKVRAERLGVNYRRRVDCYTGSQV